MHRFWAINVPMNASKPITGIAELTVPLAGNITNAVVNFASHDVSLVAVAGQSRSGRKAIGYGFNSIGRFAQGGILRERLIPRVLESDPGALLDDEGELCPSAVRQVAMRNEKPGGHGDRAGAMAALELAIWDLKAKLGEEPAWSLIARSSGRDVQNPDVSTYAAGGYYYDDDSLGRLVQELKDYRSLGFDAFKIKIGGASMVEDMERIQAAIEASGASERVALDANGRFDLALAQAWQAALEPLAIRWFEEPGDPLDFQLLSQLAESAATPLATGENLFSLADTRNLVRYGGFRPGRDVFQMDAGLSYGLGEYMEMVSELESAGHDRSQCFPHGGHLINLHIAAGLGLGGCEAYPGVFQPFGGFSSGCEMSEGRVAPSQAPGFGLEEKAELKPFLDQLTEKLG